MKKEMETKLKDIYRELKEKQVNSGDQKETYKSGYNNGYINGKVEIIENLLGLDNNTSTDEEDKEKYTFEFDLYKGDDLMEDVVNNIVESNKEQEKDFLTGEKNLDIPKGEFEEKVTAYKNGIEYLMILEEEGMELERQKSIKGYYDQGKPIYHIPDWDILLSKLNAFYVVYYDSAKNTALDYLNLLKTKLELQAEQNSEDQTSDSKIDSVFKIVSLKEAIKTIMEIEGDECESQCNG